MNTKNRKFSAIILFTAILSCVCLAAGSVLSPALAEIEKQLEMKKCGVINKTVSFNSADFDTALCADTEFIKIETLPNPSDGKLTIGTLPVSENQLVARKDLDKLIFSPASDSVCTANFTFSNATVGFPNTTVTCIVSVLEEENFAPEAGSYTVNTAKNISAFKFLKAADPENDDLTYEVISYPAHGTVTVMENADGLYCYKPKNGYVGKDSFEYAAYDKYGNRSNTAKVEIKVSRPESDVYFHDLENHWAHNSAIKTAAMGLMTGNIDATTGNHNFEPAAPVSRGDFLAMALISAGREDEINFVPTTVFADDASIPVNIKSYAQYALDNGIIKGYTSENGHPVFSSSSPITRAEAAVIVNNILSLPKTSHNVPVFADSASVPSWATSAISTLASYGILNGTGFGEIMPDSIVTRAETAEILCNIDKY